MFSKDAGTGPGREGASAPPGGIIFNVQRFSTEDGPGLRTTVFFKGCPLRCRWCHNPEGLSPHPQLVWSAERCLGCGTCVKACPLAVLAFATRGGADPACSATVLRIDRSRCRACGTCAEACPSRALEVLGRRVSADELVAELARDAEFYRVSGGGVTFSGGECLFQPEFFLAAAKAVKDAGLELAVDTSGLAPPHLFERALALADLVLYDVKLIDPERHRQATGVDNRVILDNARRLAASGCRFWVRFPVIPGWTDDEDNVRAVARFVAREMAGVERVDFLAYNNLGEGDWARLGLAYDLAGQGLLEPERMERALEIARREGLDPRPSGLLARDGSGRRASPLETEVLSDAG
ncbi:MAG: glycyl-radical enzyme activating protein [Firmicutes bacterium]|nr:glycyl-radical enzyme activating protein [Bacillota bacterium]